MKEILVIDDNEEKAKCIELFVAGEIKVDYAENTMEGVRLYEDKLRQGREYVLVVTDLEMPAEKGKSPKIEAGIWLYKSIKGIAKSWDKETPVIFHTTHKKSRVEELLRQHGVEEKIELIDPTDFESYDLLEKYM